MPSGRGGRPAKSIAGSTSVDEALQQSQEYAQQVARTYQREEGQ